MVPRGLSIFCFFFSFLEVLIGKKKKMKDIVCGGIEEGCNSPLVILYMTAFVQEYLFKYIC